MRGTGPAPSGRSRRLRAGLVLGVALALSLPAGAAGSPMVALDAASRRRLWTTELTPGTSTSFHAPPNVAGGVVYATTVDDRVYARPE